MDGNAISIEVGISGYAAKNFKTFFPGIGQQFKHCGKVIKSSLTCSDWFLYGSLIC